MREATLPTSLPPYLGMQEARIAFLEEEVPGLVAKGASLGEEGSLATAAPDAG